MSGIGFVTSLHYPADTLTPIPFRLELEITKSTFAGNAPILTTAQAVKGGNAFQGQVIHLYGKLTQLGNHPRLDDSIDLIPGFGGNFEEARVGQMMLVRGFIKSDRRHGMGALKLTSAVWYPGIEKAHEAELAKLRGEP
jgi:hypothetical protein